MTQRSRSGRGLSMVLAALLLVVPAEAAVRDPVGEARQLYNDGSYDNAIAAAEAITVPTLVNAARLVAGRARLERYRKTRDETDLVEARDRLASIAVASLTAREHLELIIGFAETLFLEGLYGASAELFSSVVDQPAAWQAAGPQGRERLLEWWAAAIDREAQQLRGLARDDLFVRMRERMSRELEREPASPVASFWLAAASRGTGDLDRAWDAAVAGWLRARLAGARSRELSNDLDRLVRESIIPARARRRAENVKDVPPLEEAMLADWNQVKARWPL